MEYRRHSHGLLTFLEHWGLLYLLVVYFLAAKLFLYLIGVEGASWLGLCAGAIVLQIVGAVLIGWAKLPAYRSGCYFTFGIKSIPAHVVGHYRWGGRVFWIGVVLSLGLLMGKL